MLHISSTIVSLVCTIVARKSHYYYVDKLPLPFLYSQISFFSHINTADFFFLSTPCTDVCIMCVLIQLRPQRRNQKLCS